MNRPATAPERGKAPTISHQHPVASVHEVGWLAANEVLNVGDQLVGECLHRFIARPRDMRCKDEVRCVEQAEQRVIVAWRLRCQHIEPGTTDQTLAQRRD